MEGSIRRSRWRLAAACAIVPLAVVMLSGIVASQNTTRNAARPADPASAPASIGKLRGLPYDWSHHHLIFSRPASPEIEQRLKHDPRYRMQQARRGARTATVEQYMQSLDAIARQLAAPKRTNAGKKSKQLTGDWSVNIGSSATVGAARYPAKFSFNPIGNPDCTNDFVVFNTGKTGASSQASLLAFNKLYDTTCSGGPAVYWSYNTGGLVSNSVVLSADGTQIAFVHSSTTASLVILKWKALQGTSYSSPVSPDNSYSGSGGAASYASCRTTTASCQLTLTFSNMVNDSSSSPFYDYSGDILYVGDDSGKVHKFTGIFSGTPTEAGAPWPISIGNFILNSPVVDSGASPSTIVVSDRNGVNGGHVDYFALPSPSSTATPSIIKSASIGLGSVDLADSPIVDSSTGHIYEIVSTDKNGQSGAFVFSRGFSNNGSGTESSIGTGTASAGGVVQSLYAGDFDNRYYSSLNGTGNLYTCGNAGATLGLYQVPINSGSPAASKSSPAAIASSSSSSNKPCSPVTEVYNSTATGGPFDWIFLSVQALGAPATCAGGGCVMNFLVTAWQSQTAYLLNQEVLDSNLNIQKVTTAGTSGASNPAWTTSTTSDGSVVWTYQGAMAVNASRAEAGGTSGIILDNTSTTTGASQVYFSTLTNAACGTGGSGGCAVQASQAKLQ
jgi:hypothetical protein